MDSKLEYITRLFKKTSAKGLETYVITRLWHLLNDNEIKLVPQQYVNHNKNEYALTDLYLPQFGLHVEINEPGHYRSEESIARDLFREDHIIKASAHTIVTIDCTKSIREVHHQIDRLIDLIQSQMAMQKEAGSFTPWRPDEEYKAAYYKQRDLLSVKDNIVLETIEQICELFQVKVPKMGFLRKGAASHNTKLNTIIWWPASNNANWQNTISSDEHTIIERAKNEKQAPDHANGIINHPHQRITFFKDRDILGYTYYRFKGVFDLDLSRSSAANGLYWVRVSETVDLNPF